MTIWLFRWGPAALIMGIIFIASSTPGSDLPDFGIIDLLVRKGGHLVGYALLGAAFFHGLSSGKSQTRSWIIITEILVILYALSDEWHQSFSPGRNPALMDICIDAAGGLIGIASLYFARKRWSHSRKQDSQSIRL